MSPIFAPKPAVIGHRGLGGADGYIENTLASCLAAVSAGASWVEVDARRCADGELVAYHNPATPDGGFIVERTAAALGAQGVSRLADILAELPLEVGVNIDLKSELEDAVCAPTHRTCALLARLLAPEVTRRPVFVSSFDPASLLYLRQQLPRLALGLLTWVHFPLRHAVPAAARLGLDAVALHVGSFGPNPIEGRAEVHRTPERSVSVAHEAGLEVVAWCPAAEPAAGLARSGVDALCVNDVQGVLDALGGPPFRQPREGG